MVVKIKDPNVRKHAVVKTQSKQIFDQYFYFPNRQEFFFSASLRTRAWLGYIISDGLIVNNVIKTFSCLDDKFKRNNRFNILIILNNVNILKNILSFVIMHVELMVIAHLFEKKKVLISIYLGQGLRLVFLCTWESSR